MIYVVILSYLLKQGECIKSDTVVGFVACVVRAYWCWVDVFVLS
jgi:hypothetical protein